MYQMCHLTQSNQEWIPIFATPPKEQQNCARIVNRILNMLLLRTSFK